MTPKDLVEQLLDESMGLKAAIKIGGKVFLGLNHGDALMKAADAGALKKHGIRSSADMDTADWESLEKQIASGFFHKPSGRFLSRQQAEDLVRKAGKDIDVSRDDGISAEDLGTIR